VHYPARVHVLRAVQELPHDAPHLRHRGRQAIAVLDAVEHVVEAGPEALHHERDLAGVGIDGERVQVDEGRVAAAGREEAGLFQHLGGGGVVGFRRW
jgi:hypothetical protein